MVSYLNERGDNKRWHGEPLLFAIVDLNEIFRPSFLDGSVDAIGGR